MTFLLIAIALVLVALPASVLLRNWSQSRTTTSRKAPLGDRIARFSEAREARKEFAATGPRHRAG
jgi:hypothetical protein